MLDDMSTIDSEEEISIPSTVLLNEKSLKLIPNNSIEFNEQFINKLLELIKTFVVLLLFE